MINQLPKEKHNTFKNKDFQDVYTLRSNIKGLIYDAINQHVSAITTFTKHSHTWMHSDLRQKKAEGYTMANSGG